MIIIQGMVKHLQFLPSYKMKKEIAARLAHKAHLLNELRMSLINKLTYLL